jgi:hypothetical protein
MKKNMKEKIKEYMKKFRNGLGYILFLLISLSLICIYFIIIFILFIQYDFNIVILAVLAIIILAYVLANIGLIYEIKQLLFPKKTTNIYIKKFKHWIDSHSFLLIGLFFIYMIYIRIFINREPDEFLKYYGFRIIILAYVLAIIGISFYLIKQLLFPKETTNIYIKKFKEKYVLMVTPMLLKIHSIYEKKFTELYNFLVNDHKYNFFVRKILRNLLIFFYTFFRNYGPKLGFRYTYPCFFYYVFCGTPKLIFAICLFYDVVIINKFVLLSKFGFILIFPIIWSSLFFFLEKYWSETWEKMNYFFFAHVYSQDLDCENHRILQFKRDYDFLNQKTLNLDPTIDWMQENILTWHKIHVVFLNVYKKDGLVSTKKFYKKTEITIKIIYLFVMFARVINEYSAYISN